ncbi:MAG: VOC family protein [Dehalococcoidia bacterium]|nr:VOC family protein [Dehalococcoidia bacterium]
MGCPLHIRVGRCTLIHRSSRWTPSQGTGGNVELKPQENREFNFSGINHLALVCKDMERTVHFYRDILGMPLIKTLDLPKGMGQHFFFDIGNGDCLAFFWFPDAPEAHPGVSSPAGMPGLGQEITTAHGSMNHVAFNVAEDKFDEYVQKLHDKGLNPSPVLNHDDSKWQVAKEMHPGVFVRSVYFMDPDGIMLEFATWTKVFTEADAQHKPARYEDRERYLEMGKPREAAGVS